MTPTGPRSRVGRCVVAALVSTVLVTCVLGCGSSPASSPSLVPTPDGILGTARNAIDVYYRESELPSAYAPGSLSEEQHQFLRSRIIADFGRYYTGSALSERLNATLKWADTVAGVACVRTTEARINSFEGSVGVSSEASTIVVGTYRVYQVNAAGSGANVTSWGGTLTMSYVATFELVDGAWLVSVLSQQQQGFVPDPSLGTPTSVAPATSTVSSSPDSGH